MSKTAFSSLTLQPALLENLASLNYLEMTPIQAEGLPTILAGKDVIAQAQTGSGKTAAFGIGLLENLNVKRFRIQSLVLCPTRELADQVAKELRKLARRIHNIKILTLCGGMPFGPQIGSLEHGAHIIVGTPGRIEEHLRKGKLILDEINTLVLDEADRMLDMGFQNTLDAIFEYIPKQRQTLLFSATYPAEIHSIAQHIMQTPTKIVVESSHDKTSIEQVFYQLGADNSRLIALQLLLQEFRPSSAIVFCNTKRETEEVANGLRDFGLSALALHGDLEQRVRDQTLVRFSNKSASVLVATDVAARGLDIDSLDAVINYQIARELEVHTHRIGRTGRAGKKGMAFTLLHPKESFKFKSLEEYLEQKFESLPLPSLALLEKPRFKAAMVTLQIDGGKKQKIRPGDILGALTSEHGITGQEVGKINIFDNWSYVAVTRDAAPTALSKLSSGKLKGRSCRVRKIR